jgi:hypothetical protein
MAIPCAPWLLRASVSSDRSPQGRGMGREVIAPSWGVKLPRIMRRAR